MTDQQRLEELTDHLKDYVQTNIDIVKLEASGRLASLSTWIISSVIIGFCAALFVIFISIGAGFYLSFLLGDSFTGFFIVAGIYLLIVLILFFGKKKLMQQPIRDAIVNVLIDEEDVL
jgi:ABC-type glycerol-3-phosphate transport system permease component